MNFALNVVAKASIILMVAALLSVLLRRASASTRHAVWMLAIASTVVLPFAAALIPQLELPVLPEASTSVGFLPAAVSTAVVATVEPGLKRSTAYLAETWSRVPAVVWIGGVAFLVLRVLLGILGVRRLAKSANVPADETWLELVTQVSRSFSITRPVRLLLTDAQVSPMTWGVFRHTILLPMAAMHWSEDRCRLVLAHELAHVKRNDGMVQMFVQIVCSVYWFNPLVWYAAHRTRTEREHACDDRVLSLGTTAEDYADHLVQIVRGLRARQSFSFAAVSMAQASQLETRLVAILDSGARRRTVSKVAIAFLCGFTVLLTISIAVVAVTAAVPLPPVLMAATKFVMPEPEAKPEPAAPQRTHIGEAGAVSNTAVTPPQIIESSPPLYTDEALTARIEGTVTIEASVDIQGNADILRVVKGLGYGLDQRAIGAILNWKFAPALKNGVPVQAVTQIEVDFKLPPAPPVNIPFNIKINAGDQLPLIPRSVSTGGSTAGNTPSRIMPAGVFPPTIISRVEPQYPEEARKARWQGTVVLEVIVRKDGTCDVIRVVRSLGTEFKLDESATEALKQWRFKPGTRNGEPVDINLNVEVNFNLK